ncbi:unnamed protein product [Bursaphelenchus okinawaensis]|uniref:G-protein coupled receptors family 1 profile domain-containing protein n=1 Tax=Bursaphelenchus okinawaensis TaxID=465554 RepID=A0A811KVA8_9BILA|nr:unnamed protein product [Bursaphelenchus okinawaensis]CAG9112471.1 unnamed protein product [Bursaphelenchus okinawaensis]
MTTPEVLSYSLALCSQTLLCVVGTILNIVCLLAFMTAFTQSYYRKTSLLIYLVALSVCNTLQLTLSFFVIVLPATEQFMDDLQYPSEYELLRSFNQKTLSLAYPLLMSANYASIWILTLICAQRYQSICHPSSPWKRRLGIFKHSTLCVAVVVIFSLLFNFPRYWELHGIREYLLYKIIQEGIIYGFVVYGAPMTLLIWLNYNTIQIVRKHDDIPLRPSAEHRTALMTSSVFTLFFLCTTLSASLRLILIVKEHSLRHLDDIWLVDLSNLLMNANAITMPVVCFIFTRGFRDLFFVIRYPINGACPRRFLSSSLRKKSNQLLQPLAV